MGFRFEIRIDGQNRQNGGLRGVCAASRDPPSRTTTRGTLGRGTARVSLKIRRAEDESGSAARGGEDKKILKGVESHRKIEARCFTVHLQYQSVKDHVSGSSCPNQPYTRTIILLCKFSTTVGKYSHNNNKSARKSVCPAIISRGSLRTHACAVGRDEFLHDDPRRRFS